MTVLGRYEAHRGLSASHTWVINVKEASQPPIPGLSPLKRLLSLPYPGIPQGVHLSCICLPVYTSGCTSPVYASLYIPQGVLPGYPSCVYLRVYYPGMPPCVPIRVYYLGMPPCVYLSVLLTRVCLLLFPFHCWRTVLHPGFIPVSLLEDSSHPGLFPVSLLAGNSPSV